LIVPSLEREIRRELSEEAEAHAVKVFARNLHSLLMQPPLRANGSWQLIPVFGTGCKIAALDEHGNLLKRDSLPPSATAEAAKEKERRGAETAAPNSAAPATPDAAPPSSDGGSQLKATELNAPASLVDSSVSVPVPAVATFLRAGRGAPPGLSRTLLDI